MKQIEVKQKKMSVSAYAYGKRNENILRAVLLCVWNFFIF